VLRDYLKKLLSNGTKEDARKFYKGIKKDKNGHFNGSLTMGNRKQSLVSKMQDELNRLAKKGISTKEALAFSKFNKNMTTKQLSGVISTLKGL
jgi:hypothetical protein